ncbi:oxygenase MpaB family protein [Arthrobacter cryoconiti]|uniref:Oxygenase MpaB family protein n=1 Tax=Arthrobacter cryoconiti TaxID=748907 RepID=A0ABV8R4E7_9MICC|nr:oxygenase MpaB family protein [Arthrobacter cryoconiti]MCC9066740.1 oxygenase MpaB family protein [Arthrobacter cryoconiti]
MPIHSSLTMSAGHQADAAPERWEATYRQMVLFDLAADMELGFFLAYYRNFAIPSIAATLQRNGEIIERPMKRSYDTAIVTYELITSGLDSDRGRHMMRLLNHVHRHVSGSQDDFLYVLLTLLFVPVRWARAHAWRAPTLTEETAATRFCQELGARMNIAGIPATFQDAERFFDSYERDNIAYSPAGAQLMASTVQVLKSRLPAAARPLTSTILSAMFDDDRLSDALRLPRATQIIKTSLHTVLKARNTIHRRRPLSSAPHFVPGEEGSSLYPNGYRLDDIGPENIMTPASQPDH